MDDSLKKEIELCYKKLEGLDEIIDKLKADNERLRGVATAFKDTRDMVIKENAALKAEVEHWKAAPTPPAPEVEPVAWVPVHPALGPLFGATSKHKILAEGGAAIPVIPLYTHPANDKLRKAAEEALKLLVNLESGYGFEDDSEYAVLDNLRAALNKEV